MILVSLCQFVLDRCTPLSYLETFRNDGQSGASNILCFIVHLVIGRAKRLISYNGLRLAVFNEPDSKDNKKIKTGDLLVVLMMRDRVVPVLLIELSVRSPTQPPAQLLQELKFLYQKYECQEITAIVVYSTFLVHMITFSDVSSLRISHHTAITPLTVSLSRKFVVEKQSMVKLIQSLYGLFVQEVLSLQATLPIEDPELPAALEDPTLEDRYTETLPTALEDPETLPH